MSVPNDRHRRRATLQFSLAEAEALRDALDALCVDLRALGRPDRTLVEVVVNLPEPPARRPRGPLARGDRDPHDEA